jgi:hypothetical protein
MSSINMSPSYIPGLYGNLIQVLDLGTAITIETEMSESTTAEEMAAVDKVPTTA